MWSIISIHWLCRDVLFIGIVFDPIVGITIWQFVNAMQKNMYTCDVSF